MGYERESSNNWVQLGSDINGKKRDENSGKSIAFSYDGSRVAVGSPNANLVRVYDLDCDYPPSPFIVWVRKNGVFFWCLVGICLVLLLIPLVLFYRFKKLQKEK